MNNKRPVSFPTLFTILKGYKPFFILGLTFSVLSVFILTPVLIAITIFTKSPYEKYDFKAIEKYGIEATATITGIDVLYNTTINGEHPRVISYLYYEDGQSYSDNFKTLMSNNSVQINLKDTIKIKVYNHQSIIENMKPFSFPYYIFYILPLVFLMVGIPFLIAGLIPGLKKLRLYQYGDIKDAIIVALYPKLPYGKNNFRPYVLVEYYFINTMGQKIKGRSNSYDINSLKVGDKIKVYVSENGNSESCLA